MIQENFPAFRNTSFQVQEPECPQSRWRETLAEAQLCDISVTGDQENKILKYCGEGKDSHTQVQESKRAPGSRRWWVMAWKCSGRVIDHCKLYTKPVKCEHIWGHFQTRVVSDTPLPGTLPKEATRGGSPTGEVKKGEDAKTQETGFWAHKEAWGPLGRGEWRWQGFKVTWPPGSLWKEENSPKK